MVCIGLLLDLFILLFCSIIPTMRTFLVRNVHHRSWKRVSTVFHADLSTKTLNSAADPLLAWKDLKKNVLVPGNNTATLLNLIELGDQWSAGQPDKDLPFYHVSTSIPGYHKVPGCMASVHLKLLSSSASTQDKVMITGRADSRVAQGMLAFLAKGLSKLSQEQVMSLKPAHVTHKLGFDTILPMGRLNGFQNMLIVVQTMLSQPATTSVIDENSSKVVHVDINEDESSASSSTMSKLNLPEIDAASSVTFPSTLANERADEVAMLLSGGVDSSVALKLLIDQGKKVRAYYLKIWLEDELKFLNDCPWEEDLRYATETCQKLGVPLEVVSLQKEYFNHVVKYTIDEARVGRTPNPDIMCNSMIKFGMFVDFVGKYHHKIATGHYALVDEIKDDNGVDRVRLLSSPDRIKDQSYFLSNLRQDQLQKCLFPIGHLEKVEVRKLAEQFDLPSKTRKDSQGICFLGKLSFDQFIGHYLGEQVGEIRDAQTNRVIGSHKGLWYHTIGQRKGVGLLLNKGYVHDGPYYVVDKHIASNTLYVTNNYTVIDAPRRFFRVEHLNWIMPLSDSLKRGENIPVKVKLRHGPNLATAVMCLDRSNEVQEKQGVFVELAEKDKGIAPGQFAVFYDETGSYVVAAGAVAFKTTK